MGRHNTSAVLLRLSSIRKAPVIVAAITATFLLATTANEARSADCAAALETVFGHEGGYQNSSKDAGNWSSKKVGVGKMCGGTKYGIACGHNPGVDIKTLTREQAAEIYRNRECKDMRMEELSGTTIPTLLLDLAVNMGSDMAVKLMGTTINVIIAPSEPLVFEEVMTDEMVAQFNALTKTRESRGFFFAVLTLTAIDRYAFIVEKNPKQAVWLLGWIRRVIPNEIEAIRPSRTPKN
jgi:Glycosyl hydrolase 108